MSLSGRPEADFEAAKAALFAEVWSVAVVVFPRLAELSDEDLAMALGWISDFVAVEIDSPLEHFPRRFDAEISEGGFIGGPGWLHDGHTTEDCTAAVAAWLVDPDAVAWVIDSVEADMKCWRAFGSGGFPPWSGGSWRSRAEGGES